uniref:Metalloendopeptidase n=1 Tax=Anopheles stephensi TaxID=30069 RepID=A0A182YPE0_ANOST
MKTFAAALWCVVLFGGESYFEETGGFFEGDMILSPEQSDAVKNGYTAVLGEASKWPNNIVYYMFNTAVFTTEQQNLIRKAMDQIELVTCIRFVPRTTQKGFSYITTSPQTDCSSYVGYHGGQQTLNLNPSGCLYVGTIIHELLHTLGFVHMHTASDRDFYVDINFDAIKPEHQSNFRGYNSSLIDDYGIPYDYESVMHYGRTAFSKDGQPTIIPKKPNAIIGQRNGLSAKDIKRINQRYPNYLEMANKFEEVGGNFEGDIELTSDQEKAVKYGYTAIIGESYKWPNNIVPYTIDTSAFTISQQNSILFAIQQIELVSCVRFKPRTTETDYVTVRGEGTGCWASLGHRGGPQTVNLQPNGCMSRGTIIHEFLHALGFVHMQSASDRDFYVTINWSAMQADRASNFERYSSNVVEDFGIPYDYDSVMHYGPTAFTYNGQPTIVPKQPGVTIGQRVGLSYKDIKRLNFFYPNCY